MTSAPARRARSVVRSMLPAPTTIPRATNPREPTETPEPMDASSFNVGMMTATLPVESVSGRVIGLMSQAPAQPAILAGGRRSIRHQSVAEIAIGVACPNFAQCLLRGIAERIVLVPVLGE